MDPLVLVMADFMLGHALSASELHEAIEQAVDLIEANPKAARAADLKEKREVPQ